jgi:hypothetical protein
MFQATKSDKEDARKLVRTINAAVSATPVVDRVFDRMWPDLQKKLETIPPSSEVAAPERAPEDMMAEILNIARAQADTGESIEARIANIETILNRAPAPFSDFTRSSDSWPVQMTPVLFDGTSNALAARAGVRAQSSVTQPLGPVRARLGKLNLKETNDPAAVEPKKRRPKVKI